MLAGDEANKMGLAFARWPIRGLAQFTDYRFVFMNNFFSNCFSEAEIKARYRELCKIHHPDLGGDVEMMKALNLAYEDKLRGEFHKHYSTEETEDFINLEREVAAKVAEIIALKGITVELVGRWVWVTGNTWPVHQILKAAQFFWASKKKAWYWHKPEDSCPSRAKKSLEEIKAKYGSQVLRGEMRSQLQG